MVMVPSPDRYKILQDSLLYFVHLVDANRATDTLVSLFGRGYSNLIVRHYLLIINVYLASSQFTLER